MQNGESSYRRFLAGDESAFDELLDLYQKSLIFFLYRYVSNWTVAEEIAADTFALLVIKPEAYKFKVSLKTWLFTLGRNRAIDYLRRLKHRKTVPPQELPHLAADEADNPEALFIQKERELALHRALDRLKEDYRSALHLVYFEDLSYEEAGQILHKSRKQMDNLIYRAKDALRAELEKEGITQ